jgi:hypothetical protein
MMNRKARRAQRKQRRKLPPERPAPDAKAIEQWTSTPEYQRRAKEWLEHFKAKGVAVPLAEAAASFAAAVAIDVPLARGILRRVADPEGYANFIARRGGEL